MVDITSQPETWPESVLIFARAAMEMIKLTTGADNWEAMQCVRWRLVTGQLKIPAITVEQRDDGSWPAVSIACAINWKKGEVK